MASIPRAPPPIDRFGTMIIAFLIALAAILGLFTRNIVGIIISIIVGALALFGVYGTCVENRRYVKYFFYLLIVMLILAAISLVFGAIAAGIVQIILILLAMWLAWSYAG